MSLQLFGRDPKIMSEMAKRIEEILDVQMPSSMDRYTISQFISAYHKEFLQKEREGNKKTELRIKEEISIADIAREMGFSVEKKGRYLSLKEHDSVIIDTERNCFWRNSRSGRGSSIGRGGSVIDFVVEFSTLDSKEATRELAHSRVFLSHYLQIKYLFKKQLMKKRNWNFHFLHNICGMFLLILQKADILSRRSYRKWYPEKYYIRINGITVYL